MALLFLLLSFCSRSYGVTLPQPSAVAAVVGSSVNISCYMQLGAEPVSEKYLYWYMPGPKEDSELFVFPNVAPKIPTNISQSSLQRASPNHDTDMSLTIAKVKLLYTGVYVCHMSVRIKGKKLSVFGNGTYLLVHEPLDISIITTNVTSVVCSTEVQAADNVTLIWEIDGREAGEFSRRSLRNSYGMRSDLRMGSGECRDNVTASCFLQYMGSTLANKSIEIPCTAFYNGQLEKKPQPVILYAMLLTSSSLILLVVILVHRVRARRRKRREELSVSYTNLHSIN